MDYIIRNYKDVYIKLNANGQPITCPENEKQLFKYSKAKNICDSLPKPLKKLKFKVGVIPDIIVPKEVINGEDYNISDNISRWVDKFGVCDGILDEVRNRKEELIENLSNTDKEFSNIIHRIELEKPKDLYHGWLLYKEIKTNRKKRRNIKDELLIISNILRMDFKNFSSNNIKKAVDGLANRKFSLRIVEEGDEDVL